MIRVLWLFSKSLVRIAAALEQLLALYKLDLESRGIIRIDPTVRDTTEVAYGYVEPVEDV